MAEPNGYIQGTNGVPIEMVDSKARQELPKKLTRPATAQVGDYLRIKAIGADGTMEVEAVPAPTGGNVDLSGYATEVWVQELLAQFPTFEIEVVQELPAAGEEKTIYLVPFADDSGSYLEYLYVNGAWEVVGSGKGSGGNLSKIDVLDADPSGADLYEGRIWLLRSGAVEAYVTSPVISFIGKTDTTIAISLDNASYDESGAIVNSYKVYLNDALMETVTLSPGASYTFSGLTGGSTYAVKLSGVKGETESAYSNVLAVTTESGDSGPETPDDGAGIVYLSGYTVRHNAQYQESLAIITSGDRTVTVLESGDRPLKYENGGESQYYLIPIDASAVAVTVECDGLMFGLNGFNYADGQYTYALDSGWKDSGATVEFEAGQFAYFAVVFKSGTASLTGYDTSKIKISATTQTEGG